MQKYMKYRENISYNAEMTAKNQVVPIEENIASMQEQAKTYPPRSLDKIVKANIRGS